MVPPRLAHKHQSHWISHSSLLEELADPLSRELTGHNANRSYCLLNAHGVLDIMLRVYKTAQDLSTFRFLVGDAVRQAGKGHR